MARVVAIIDWSQGGLLKDNVRFVERAGSGGKVQPRGARLRGGAFRSLTVYEDGRCQFQALTARAAARRLGAQRAARRT